MCLQNCTQIPFNVSILFGILLFCLIFLTSEPFDQTSVWLNVYSAVWSDVLEMFYCKGANGQTVIPLHCALFYVRPFIAFLLLTCPKWSTNLATVVYSNTPCSPQLTHTHTHTQTNSQTHLHKKKKEKKVFFNTFWSKH